MRPLLLASVCLIAGLLTSCFEGKEEFWLNANGSGAAEITYDVPAKALAVAGGEKAIRESVDELIHESVGIRCEALEISSTGDRTKVHVRIAFDSVLKVADLSKPGQTETMPATLKHLVGEFEFKREGRAVFFSRTVSPNRALAGGLFIPRKDIEGRRLVYVMHLPEVPVSSDATRTEDGGKTLVWEFSFAEALKHPVVTSIRANIPIPAWVIAATVVVVVVLLGAIYWLIRLLLRRRRQAVASVAKSRS